MPFTALPRLLPSLLCLLAWGGLSSPASAKETLVWGVFDFPPFQILEGPHRGSGSFDGELQLLVEKLPEYEHKIVPMSFARRQQEFLAGSHLCTPGIFKAPAEKLKLAISLPALTHLDNRVIFRGDKEALFGSGQAIDIDTLFEHSQLVGAIVPGRSYAPNIDAAIARHRGTPNLISRPLGTAQLFQMLLGGHVDYLLMFSHEAAFLANQFEARGRVQNRPIFGTPPYLHTHVACTGDAWGQEVIRRIDAVLHTARGQPDYRAFSERWYPDQDQAKVRRHYPAMLKAGG